MRAALRTQLDADLDKAVRAFCGMTFRMALKHVRRNALETEETFRIICRNRYCHPVREWAIFDLATHEKLSRESAERHYYRHLARLHEVFGVSQVG